MFQRQSFTGGCGQRRLADPDREFPGFTLMNDRK